MHCNFCGIDPTIKLAIVHTVLQLYDSIYLYKNFRGLRVEGVKLPWCGRLALTNHSMEGVEFKNVHYMYKS